jgi:hypothetical protein
VRAVLRDHLEGGKYAADEVRQMIAEVPSEKPLREATLAVGYFPANISRQ